MRVFAGALRWALFGLISIFSGFLVVNAFRLGTPGIAAVMVADALLVLTLLLISFALARFSRSAQHAEIGACVVAAAIQADMVFTVWVRSQPADLFYAPIIVIWAGALMLSWRGVWAVLLIVCSSTVSTALVLGTGSTPIDAIAALLTSCALSLMIFAARSHALRELEQLRQLEATRTQQLRDALKAVEREFREHRATAEREQRLKAELEQAHRLESLGVLAGGVAHDMNNVLGIIAAIASTAQSRFAPADPTWRDLREILAASKRGTAFTGNLLAFARQLPNKRERVSLHELVEEVVRLLTHTLPPAVQTELKLEATFDKIQGDDGQLAQLLMNLCINGADAMPNGGKLIVRTRDGERVLTDGRVLRVVELSVTDEGTGMAPATKARAFEPFFTTKNNLERSGLGLSQVYRAVVDHDGDVHIDSTEGAGTTVTVRLPALPAARAGEPRPRDPTPLPGTTPTVLVVDDEPMLRKAAARILTALGYRVLTAEHGQAALDLFAQHGNLVELVLLDLAMPVMNGDECFRRLRELRANLPIVITSGHPRGSDLEPLLDASHVSFLLKPYAKQDLTDAIATALGTAA